MTGGSLEETTAFQRLVLLGVADLDARASTPAHSFEVKEACEGFLDGLSGAPVEGGITRREVVRALSALTAAGLLAEHTDDASPVGKGRPAYDLAVDRGPLLARLADDDLLGTVARGIEGG